MKFIAKIIFILEVCKLLASAKHVQDIQEIEADRGKCLEIGILNIFHLLLFNLYVCILRTNTFEFILQFT